MDLKFTYNQGTNWFLKFLICILIISCNSQSDNKKHEYLLYKEMSTGKNSPVLSIQSSKESFITYKRNTTEIKKELVIVYDRNLQSSGAYNQLFIENEKNNSEYLFRFSAGYGSPQKGDVTSHCVISFKSKTEILEFLDIIGLIFNNPEKNLTYDFNDLVIKSEFYQKDVFGANIYSNCKYPSFILGDEIESMKNVLKKYE